MISTLLQVTNLSGTTIYLDLYDDVSFALNMSFAEIQDVTSRNSGYSQSFKVPGTANNNAFFNYMFNVNQESLTFDFQQSVPCSINYKGMTVLDGILRLLNVTVTDNDVEYNVNVQDEIGIFVNDITNKLLVDLDFTDLNHTYNATNVRASWYGTYTGGTASDGLKDGQILYPFAHIGYIYDKNGNVITEGSNASPLLELRGDVGSISNETTPMRTTGFKPAIQIYSVLKRIFNQNGYAIESDFFATEYFQRLFMPLLFNSDSYFISTTGATNGNLSVTTSYDRAPQAFNVSPGTCTQITGWTPFDIIIFNNGPQYPPTGFNTANGRYYAYAGGQYEFTSTITLAVPSNQQDGNHYLKGKAYYFKNRTTKYNVQTFNTATPGASITLLDTGTVIPMSVGDYIEYVIEWQQTETAGGCGGGSFKYSPPLIMHGISNMNIVDAPNVIVGSTIDINSQFSNQYKQLDFLKGIITQFNMVLVKHPFKSYTYVMEPYDDYVGKGQSVDWTNKLDKSNPIEIAPITNMVGKAINYVYEDDADSINTFTKSINNNRTFGTYNFIPSGITINDKPLEIKSFFAPSPCDILTYGGTPNPFIVPQFYSTKTVTNAGVTINELLPMKLKPRIVHYYGMKEVSNTWYFLDEVTATTEIYNQFPLISHQNTIPSNPTEQAIDLNFGNSASPQDTWAPTQTLYTAYELYYAGYMEDLLSTEARLVTANFYLTIEDIINLQYKDLIFVKDAWYRINKITGFDLINRKSTKVELVKLLHVDIGSIQPPTPITSYHLQTELTQNIQNEDANYIDTEIQ